VKNTTIAKYTKDDLTVIYKAQMLTKGIFLVTQNAPVKYRWSSVSKLQNISLQILQNLLMANELPANSARRQELQLQGIAQLRIIDTFFEIAREQNCMRKDQYEYLIKIVHDCLNLTRAWRKYAIKMSGTSEVTANA
jgi:hypothetical protein